MCDWYVFCFLYYNSAVWDSVDQKVVVARICSWSISNVPLQEKSSKFLLISLQEDSRHLLRKYTKCSAEFLDIKMTSSLVISMQKFTSMKFWQTIDKDVPCFLPSQKWSSEISGDMPFLYFKAKVEVSFEAVCFFVWNQCYETEI